LTTAADTPRFDNGELHENEVAEAMVKMENMSVEVNSTPRQEQVSESLEGVTEEEQSESVVSLLEQVDNRSYAEGMRAPIKGS
jgi:hypothetical protein